MDTNNTTPSPRRESLPTGTVLIAGGGPVGLLLARVLSHYGVRSILFERNNTTTHWPKMDITNVRSMEIFRKLGLADELRKRGVASHFSHNVVYTAGMQCKEPLAKWELPSVDDFREMIRQRNDGTMPAEPWQRMSQVVFERWLKEVCEADENVDVRYGWKVEAVVEVGERVETTVVEAETGATTVFVSDYVAGCDGASSKVRRALDIPVDGGPIPACALLVHFKSRDLTRIHKHGQFWHTFFTDQENNWRGIIIAQDEVDTWTSHMFIPLDADYSKLDSREVVYTTLAGAYEPYPFEIDEILVRSVWRPHICLTRTWHSPAYRVFLAGDSAHQNIPTGGYGMNTGIGDAFDLGWKLAAVINGQGGPGLLESYELERKPVAARNIERSGVHFAVHQQLPDVVSRKNPRLADEDTDEGREIRAKVQEHYRLHDSENKDFGIEMDDRYKSGVIAPDGTEEPSWQPSQYTPTTWPGARAPHIFLEDGTAVFDRFGKDWALVVFQTGDEDLGQNLLLEAAKANNLPVKLVDLSGEKLARRLYEKKLVLVRPDQHVAWRADSLGSVEEAEQILKTVTGRSETSRLTDGDSEQTKKPDEAFTATEGMQTQVGQFEVEGMAEFQK